MRKTVHREEMEKTVFKGRFDYTWSINYHKLRFDYTWFIN